MSEIKTNADVEPCLSVVMPVYNEAGTVSEVIRTVLEQRPVAQLVIVDDASTDGTWEKLQLAAKSDPRVTLVRHAYVLPSRQGEGIGGRLLAQVKSMTSDRLLVGTWKVNAGAIRFYERQGFVRLGNGESQELLRRYWKIPHRQMETSLVLEMGG